MGVVSALIITGANAGTETAGVSDNLTIVGVDASGDVVVTYAGDFHLTFSGPGNSADPVTHPTVTDKNGTAIQIGSATLITFVGGTATTSGSNNGLFIPYKQEGPVQLNAFDTDNSIGTTGTGGTGYAVTTAAATASRLKVTGTSPVVVNAGDTLTIAAKDPYGNTPTYTGDKSLIFSGASIAPSGRRPYTTDKTGATCAFGTACVLTFSLGTITSASKFYKAETISVGATATSMACTGGDLLSLEVDPGNPSGLQVAGASGGSEKAGVADTLGMTAVDDYGNTATTYTGSKVITFGGPSNAPDGTHPKVTSATGLGINVGSATTLTFTSGVLTAGGVYTPYKEEGPIALGATDAGGTGTAGTDGLVYTIASVADAGATRFVITGGATEVAGAYNNITIVAQDTYQNPAVSYSGLHNLVFSGAGVAPDGISYPTVRNYAGSDKAFGLSTGLTFSGATTAATRMYLYCTGATTVGATAATPTVTTPSPLSVTVTDAGINSFIPTPAATTMYPGVTGSVDVVAVDAYYNLAITYGTPAASKNLFFTGASASPSGRLPFTTDNTGATVSFGSTCGATFSGATATHDTVQLLMDLFDSQTFSLTVGDGTYTTLSPDKPSITVTVGDLSDVPIEIVEPMYGEYYMDLAPNNMSIYPTVAYWFNPAAADDQLILKDRAGRVLLSLVAEGQYKSQWVRFQNGIQGGIRWNDFTVDTMTSGTFYLWYRT